MSPSAPVRRRLPAGALALLLAAGLLVAPAATTAAGAAVRAPEPVGSADLAARVRQLDRDVARVSAELGRGAAAYEAAQERLARLTADQLAARADAEQQAAQASASRASRDELARAAYKGGVPAMFTALLSGDPGAVSDLAYVRRSVDALGVRLTEQARADHEQQKTAGLALARADADRRAALVLQQEVGASLTALVRSADELTARLAATADQLAQARAGERAAAARQDAARRAAQAPQAGPPPVGPVQEGTGGLCSPPSRFGEANGFLSDEGLCPLSVGGGHRLRTDAARAFEQLNAAHVASVGTPLCVTDSYRSYAAQVDVFKHKPALAATPGRSQHGWGLALDLCGGVQVFGSAAHEWMRANAGQLGWVHPPWAWPGGSKPEPWHWEYAGGPR